MRPDINKPGKSIQNKLYTILSILETMWYAVNNTRIGIRRNKRTMLYYNNMYKIHEIAQITKYIFNACPHWF